ncbi:MAG: FadR family transcriptional regulator [Spirochaetes bacterium]|nr:FadR family transcriptional regulator [Spirochaetota bacterium]
MDKNGNKVNFVINKIEKAPHIPNMVVNQIVKLIADGVLKPGDKLPSELEMTRRFGISRISLREAMKLLEAKGFIESHGRKGKYVRSALDESISSPIENMISVDHDKIWELLYVRRIIDSEAAALAATNATREQIEDLVSFLREVELIGVDEVVQKREGGRLYAKFYNDLADATNNTIFAHLMKSISSMLRGALPYSRTKLQSVPGSSRAIYEQHVAILDAIRQRQPEKAREAMRKHIDWLEENLKKILTEAR